MHTDSSASFTYFASASAWECTATVLIPISRHARCIRRAISPRFAISIFSNMSAARISFHDGGDFSSSINAGVPQGACNAQNAESFNHEQRFAILDGLPILHQYRLDDAALVRLDLIEQFHCL